ncbi:MAG: winged helix-turn-helix transcriptional regulator [Conexivisphaerales archaeon]
MERMRILAVLIDLRLTLPEIERATGIEQKTLQKCLKMMLDSKWIRRSRFYIRSEYVRYYATGKGKKMLNSYLQHLRKAIEELRAITQQRIHESDLASIISPCSVEKKIEHI